MSGSDDLQNVVGLFTVTPVNFDDAKVKYKDVALKGDPSIYRNLIKIISRMPATLIFSEKSEAHVAGIFTLLKDPVMQLTWQTMYDIVCMIRLRREELEMDPAHLIANTSKNKGNYSPLDYKMYLFYERIAQTFPMIETIKNGFRWGILKKKLVQHKKNKTDEKFNSRITRAIYKRCYVIATIKHVLAECNALHPYLFVPQCIEASVLDAIYNYTDRNKYIDIAVSTQGYLNPARLAWGLRMCQYVKEYTFDNTGDTFDTFLRSIQTSDMLDKAIIRALDTFPELTARIVFDEKAYGAKGSNKIDTSEKLGVDLFNDSLDGHGPDVVALNVTTAYYD